MNRVLWYLAVAAIGLAGCTSVGELSKSVGEGFTNYSKKNPDSLLGGISGVAGDAHTGVGNVLIGEDAKQKDAKKQ